MDHQPVRLAALRCKRREDLVEHAEPAPANEAIADRFGRPVFRRGIASSQAVPYNGDHLAAAAAQKGVGGFLISSGYGAPLLQPGPQAFNAVAVFVDPGRAGDGRFVAGSRDVHRGPECAGEGRGRCSRGRPRPRAARKVAGPAARPRAKGSPRSYGADADWLSSHMNGKRHSKSSKPPAADPLSSLSLPKGDAGNSRHPPTSYRKVLEILSYIMFDTGKK
jgi:hypothetical protein